MGEVSYSNKFATIWVRRLSKLLVISTLLLIFAGALVKSHEVGLSVPDWPTSYGYQMFFFPLTDMIGGIFYEHGHRMIATIVGLMTLILAFTIYYTDHSLWLKKNSFFCTWFGDYTRTFWWVNRTFIFTNTCFRNSCYPGPNISNGYDFYFLWVIKRKSESHVK